MLKIRAILWNWETADQKETGFSLNELIHLLTPRTNRCFPDILFPLVKPIQKSFFLNILCIVFDEKLAKL